MKRPNHTLNEKYFNKIGTQEKAYYLGWIMTDGNIRHYNQGKGDAYRICLKLSVKDEHILYDFLKEVESSAPILIQKARTSTFVNEVTGEKQIIKGGDVAYFNIYSKYMYNILRGYGLTDRKTYNLEFPMNVNSKYYPGLLAGIVSGDGSISVKKNHGTGYLIRTIFHGTHDLMKKIQQILLKNQIMLNHKKIEYMKSTKCLYRIELNQTETLNLYNWFEKHKVPLLNRKRKIVEDHIKYLESKMRGIHGEIRTIVKKGKVSKIFGSIKKAHEYVQHTIGYPHFVKLLKRNKIIHFNDYEILYRTG